MEYIRNFGENGLENHISEDQTPFDPSTIKQPNLNHTNDSTDSKGPVMTNRTDDDVLDDNTAPSDEVNAHREGLQLNT